MKIDIESGIRLKNPVSHIEPPTTFVILRVPFIDEKREQVKTKTVEKSSFPTWFCIGQTVKFDGRQVQLEKIIEKPLEFEIYH